ncbi:MAG: YraN family protein [Longispora sp.]|nr:YraN family protein [Longispora sp. (in: high G+C Gram-positive bacteria)]
MSATQAVGAYGERVAASHLVDAGLRVIDRNWRDRVGELDIVARDGDTLVFCEVKTRRGNQHGLPAEAVSATKAARIRRLARLWLAAHEESARYIRFDVISVWPQHRGPAHIEHLRDAF